MRINVTGIPTVSLLYPNGSIWSMNLYRTSQSPLGWGTFATYTVPANKTLIIATVTFLCTRETLPTYAGMCSMRLQYSPNGTSWYDIYNVSKVLTTMSDVLSLNLSLSFVCPAATQLRMQIKDDSTGGTHDYTMTANGILFTS